MKAQRWKTPEADLAAERSQAGWPDIKESSQRWWLAALLTAGMIFCYAERGALSVSTSFMIEELGLSRAEMGILLSAFFWSYSLMQVPSGWLVDQFGVRRAYAWGFALWSLASALTGFGRSLLTLIGLRMCLGIGQSVAFPASARAVANSFHDRERGTVTATYLSGVRLGQALINAVGALLIAAYGLKFFFLYIGLIPLLWLAPWSLFLRRWEKRPAAAGPAPARARGLSFGQSLMLLRQRSVLGIFLGFFAYDYAWFLYTTWLPGYLRLERKFGPAEMAFYSSVPFVIMSAVILLSGVFSDWLIRRGNSEMKVRKWLISVGMLVACLIVPAGLVADHTLAVWLLTGSLVGIGIASPNTWTLTQAVCSKNIVGTVSGIQNFGGNVGGAIAPALTGVIAELTNSFSLALTLTGVVLVMGVLSYCLLVSRPVEAGRV